MFCPVSAYAATCTSAQKKSSPRLFYCAIHNISLHLFQDQYTFCYKIALDVFNDLKTGGDQ